MIHSKHPSCFQEKDEEEDKKSDKLELEDELLFEDFELGDEDCALPVEEEEVDAEDGELLVEEEEEEEDGELPVEEEEEEEDGELPVEEEEEEEEEDGELEEADVEESTKIKILRQIADVASKLKEIVGNLITTAGKVVVTILLGLTGK